MIYNIHNENDRRKSVTRTCMCNVDISRTNPHHVVLENKISQISQYPLNSEPSPIYHVFHLIHG